MGFNFRKSIKIAPGIKVNLTKKGVSSLSVGKNGARVNIGKKGIKTTAGLPGTGFSYTTHTPFRSKSRADKTPNCLLPQEQPENESRNLLVSILLWIGVLCIPYIFAWFTLQEKYSKIERVLAFSWLLIIVFAIIIK